MWRGSGGGLLGVYGKSMSSSTSVERDTPIPTIMTTTAAPRPTIKIVIMLPPPSAYSLSRENKGPMPTHIEPSRRLPDGPQAKHVPRGQRGLGRGSAAVSYGATLILACPQ